MGEHRITLYVEGDELCEAMLADIAAARSDVRLESYIFASDEVGVRFAAALAAAAQAGRRVVLRADAAGSWDVFSAASEQALRLAGVQVVRSRRWSWRRPFKFQRRNHRKLLVVDETVAYLGGFNLHRQISRLAFGEARWRDTHARMEGPIVRDAVELFDSYAARRPRLRIAPDLYLLPNRGLKGRMLLHRLYRVRFAHARRRIWLSTPYFVPDGASTRALMRAAKRGVDVRVLVPGKSDVRIVQWAGRAAYAPLLRAGVRIYEYQPRMMHAKTVVVDDDWATIGTSNFDYRSFFINDELNAVFGSGEIVDALARQFEQDLAESVRIESEPWQKRSWMVLPGEAIGWWARRWL